MHYALSSGKTFAKIVQEINDKSSGLGANQIIKCNNNNIIIQKCLLESISNHLIFEMIEFYFRDFKDCNHVAMDIEKSRMCIARLEELIKRASKYITTVYFLDMELIVGMEKLQQAKTLERDEWNDRFLKRWQKEFNLDKH